MSSVVRTISGIEIIARAMPPASAEKMPHAHHHQLVHEQADDDGRADSSTSLMKRMTC